ncbi:hypothetical protein RN001_015013 [Aquatica leii]|uniref:RRM domain-containing protein n=1 Tax=Aquatica leii TaxID=1421715 RepID=A0AAN7SC21_9COLE|nr:hypothetical protein RN001_015013 [Aquatica leii]
MNKSDFGYLYCRSREIVNRLSIFSEHSGYPVTYFNNFRKLGPRCDSVQPERGSEIFVSGLPKDALEDEIFEFFHNVGNIFDMRLMVTDDGVYNRGYAFVRFFTPSQAKNAINALDMKYFRFYYQLSVQKSVENNRLYMCGVPYMKTKMQIWNELIHCGVDGVCDVIVYKCIADTKKNRGFVFVEFESHDAAASVRQKYHQNEVLFLFGKAILVDWSISTTEVDPDVMAKVTRLFLRNLPLQMSRRNFLWLISKVVDVSTVEKVYKKKDYAFVHFVNRTIAEHALAKLRHYFKDTDVEIIWSNPPEEFKKIGKINSQQHKVLKTLFRNGSKSDSCISPQSASSSPNSRQENDPWPVRTEIHSEKNISVNFSLDQQPAETERPDFESLFHFPTWWDVIQAENPNRRQFFEDNFNETEANPPKEFDETEDYVTDRLPPSLASVGSMAQDDGVPVTFGTTPVVSFHEHSTSTSAQGVSPIDIRLFSKSILTATPAKVNETEEDCQVFITPVEWKLYKDSTNEPSSSEIKIKGLYHSESKDSKSAGPPFALFPYFGQPERGSEIFVNGLPRDAIEDEIFEFFSKVGTIFDMRLMVTDTGLHNRGYAFVRFLNPEQAKNAINVLDQKCFRYGHQVTVQKSMENNSLYMCGIPYLKSKMQIWLELIESGVEGVTDVIVYKYLADTKKNRGFVFVEFENHDVASDVREKYYQNEVLFLFGNRISVDWAISTTEFDPDVMAKVTRLFLRNLPYPMTRKHLTWLVSTIIDATTVEKVYKKKDYGFIHFINRTIAEEALAKLKLYFSDTDVEITWSNPPEEFRKMKNKNVQQHQILKTLYCDEGNSSSSCSSTQSFSSSASTEADSWPTRTDIDQKNTIFYGGTPDHEEHVEDLENIFYFPTWRDVLELEGSKKRQSPEGDNDSDH